MIYTYKYDEESQRYIIYIQGSEVITEYYIRDREDLLIELEKLSPCLLLIGGKQCLEI